MIRSCFSAEAARLPSALAAKATSLCVSVGRKLGQDGIDDNCLLLVDDKAVPRLPLLAFCLVMMATVLTADKAGDMATT
jgi:hypothetical protein